MIAKKMKAKINKATGVNASYLLINLQILMVFQLV